MAVQPGFAFDSASTGDQISWPAGDGGIAASADAGMAFDPNDADWPGTDGGVSPAVIGGFENPTPGGGGEALIYRMRARDATLASIVFWSAPEVDAVGAFYTGPGPLTDIVVQMILGV